MRSHSGLNEDHGLGDRDSMISEPFVVAADEGDVDRGFHAVRPVVYQCPEQRAKQAVHCVIVDLKSSSVQGVAFGQRDPRDVSNPARDITHTAKDFRQLVRDGGRRIGASGRGADLVSERCHPSAVGADLDRLYEHP